MSLLKVNFTEIKLERQKYVIPKESSDTMSIGMKQEEPYLTQYCEVRWRWLSVEGRKESSYSQNFMGCRDTQHTTVC